MLVNEVEVEAGFPDVPVELVVLTLLTTITGDGAVPHLEEGGNDAFLFGDVFLLFVVVVVGVVVRSISFSMLWPQLFSMNLHFSSCCQCR